MAWTTPASYATNEVLASSKLNTHVRDNLRYLKGLDGAVVVETAAGFTVGTGTGGPVVALNGAAGQFRTLQFATNGSTRWFLGADTTAEGGSNAGSNLQIGRYSDAGAFVATALTITRSTGNAAFAGQVLLPDGSAGVPALTFSSATGEGMFLQASGAIAWGTGFTERMRLTGTELTLFNNALVGNTNLTLSATTGDVISADVLRPNADNTLTCGANGARWSAVWAANGSIQTSSRTTKHLVGAVDPAAAMASLRGVPVYRFHYLRGDGEPDTDYTHTGPMAEDMPPAMMVQPGAVSGQSTAGYLMAALQDVDARLRALEGAA